MSLAKGTQLGDWIIEHPLGAGGMGSVYKCHSVLAKDVVAAIKVLKASDVGEIEKRFVQELRTLASLKHPNIVTVHGGGRCPTRNVLYMAMELVEGEDLSKRLQRGKMPIEEALKVFGPVTNALAYAHQNNVAHRDIKPANIMVRPDGTPVVVDFGIAVSAGQTRMTQEGGVPGTIAYMPPEVFSGGQLNPRSGDAYALGVVMWEALTGQEPFAPNPDSSPSQHFAQIMGLKLRSEALDPGQTHPQAIRDIILGATDPEPEDRQHDLETLCHQMEAAGAPTGPSLPGWSGSVPLGTTNKAKTSVWKLGFTGLVSAGCATFVALGSLGAIGALLWSNGVFSGPDERPVVPLVSTLEDANMALQRKNNREALYLAGLALDDYPSDPTANLTYGLALAAADRAHLARPFLCAAKEQGLDNQLPDLDCERGQGAKAPLSTAIIMAQIDKGALLEAIKAPSVFKSIGAEDSEASQPAPSPSPSPKKRGAKTKRPRASGGAPPAPAPAASEVADKRNADKAIPESLLSQLGTRGDESSGISSAFGEADDVGLDAILESSAGAAQAGSGTAKSSSKSLVSSSLKIEVIATVGAHSEPDVRKQILRRASGMRYCHDGQLKSNPELRGFLKVFFTILEGGQVDNLMVDDQSGLNEAMRKCVISRIRRLRFESASEETEVSLRLRFSVN